MDINSIVDGLADITTANPKDELVLRDAIRALEDMSDELAKIGHSHRGRMTVWREYDPQLPLPEPSR